MKNTRLALLAAGIAVAGFLVTTACGKPDPDSVIPDGMTQVEGAGAFGSQCPYGSISDPRPVRLGLWDCPIGQDPLKLTRSPSPLVFQADCKEKTIAIRTADRQIDTLWKVMPDGSFLTTIDMTPVQLADDGSGQRRCNAYPQAEIWGKLDCTDQDRVVIKVDTIWWLARGKKPEGTTGPDCRLPRSCYLHATGSVRQCQ